MTCVARGHKRTLPASSNGNALAPGAYCPGNASATSLDTPGIRLSWDKGYGPSASSNANPRAM
eukprot:14794863-Alexandrium_andersonii.AAC.1